MDESLNPAMDARLKAFSGARVRIVGGQIYSDGEDAVLSFDNGATLVAGDWRLLKGGRHLSSFDDGHKYGLPARIEAINELTLVLDEKVISEIKLNSLTGDLMLTFVEGQILQVLNLTGYEGWTFTFADGHAEYSNYNR